VETVDRTTFLALLERTFARECHIQSTPENADPSARCIEIPDRPGENPAAIRKRGAVEFSSKEWEAPR
jgi:hypothetical protein